MQIQTSNIKYNPDRLYILYNFMVHSTISNASSGTDEERIRVVEKILDYLITLL